ncbi:hypothetical protein NB646_08290 [Oxalobacter aliiformigenes]|uniref:Molybdopterin synthase sulfur carrier subunit n=1 Tax=Oxalobacter aliiformigenes TaxID=2946593 RepID=A0A9E9LB55_9BURK|nr:hypothetical protein [Oxalobacter aliiformigenes]WAV90828.1 hypothetical protein NB646_08290 [Oxalobacter aliiformigenes]
MKVRLRYFASVREALGVSEEWVDVPEEVPDNWRSSAISDEKRGTLE